MPQATLCPKCTFHWTLNYASPRSWRCPKCGTAPTSDTLLNLCDCGHIYNEHERLREIENSLEAFTLASVDATPEGIAHMPAHAAPPDPPIGSCTKCACADYKYHFVGEIPKE